LPVINSAENVAVLLRGENKSEIAKRVIEEKDPSLPAALVRPVDGRVIFVLDKKASSQLTHLS
jgi:6-phosphogluconolactonase